MTTITVLLAIVIDGLWGEPRRLHPLVAFGTFADWLEAKLNCGNFRRTRGMLAVSIAIVPLLVFVTGLMLLMSGQAWMTMVLSAVVLYLAVGWRSLIEHAQAIIVPLQLEDVDGARAAVAKIVSRDTASLNEEAIARAATESVLENGADAVFAALFWFVVLGVPGAVLYRLSNTLDAMWGYRNARYGEFGWAAARLDDVMNLIPSRLTALSYALLGNTQQALLCWRRQGFTWKSPNAGPVMAAGAGALNVSLGGVAIYENQTQHRPPLGPDSLNSPEHSANAETVESACRLIDRALLLWIVAIGMLELIK